MLFYHFFSPSVTLYYDLLCFIHFYGLKSLSSVFSLFWRSFKSLLFYLPFSLLKGREKGLWLQFILYPICNHIFIPSLINVNSRVFFARPFHFHSMFNCNIKLPTQIIIHLYLLLILLWRALKARQNNLKMICWAKVEYRKYSVSVEYLTQFYSKSFPSLTTSIESNCTQLKASCFWTLMTSLTKLFDPLPLFNKIMRQINGS